MFFDTPHAAGFYEIHRSHSFLAFSDKILLQFVSSLEHGVEGIDTTTATGQFFFQITRACAELERHLIRERTRAGLTSARQWGCRGGRPKAIETETFAMAVQLYQARTSSVQSIRTRLGIARRTFYRYLAAQPR
jgi:DNA invertase Pin-like site-specific DNA recombinase